MKSLKLTRWEFERFYDEESGLTADEMTKLGLEPEECVGCGDRHCRGWKMVTERERKQRRRSENAKG